MDACQPHKLDRVGSNPSPTKKGGQTMAVKKFSLEAVIDLTDRMTAPLNRVEKGMASFGKKMQKNFGGFGKDIKALDKGINRAAIGVSVAAVGIGAGIAVIGKSFIDAGADVEKYKTVLTTMLGSVELANQRFEEMSQFAASTPFELNEVVQLGNQLQALGRYSKENMTTLGDLAAAAGKPIDQVTSAYSKLASGQKGMAVDMFRDLLITTDDWVKATGKGVSKSGSLLATTEEMLAALPAILAKKGFSGMMDNLSKSYNGMSSNFADTVTRFKQGIGTMLLPAAKTLMGTLTQKMGEFSDVTNKKGAAAVAKIGEVVERLAAWIASIDVAAAIDKIVGFFTTIKNVIQFLAPLTPLILGLVIAVKAITIAMAAYNAVMWLVSLNPITLVVIAIIAAIALLALGVHALVKHWDSVVQVLGIVGGFFVNIGQTIMKWMLMPINMVLDALGGLIRLIAKIPGLGDKLAPAMAAIDDFQAKMNTSLTGTAGSYDYGGVWSTPSGKAAESKSSTSTTTRNIVDIVAPKGGAVQQRGGMPAQYLQYGAAQ